MTPQHTRYQTARKAPPLALLVALAIPVFAMLGPAGAHANGGAQYMADSTVVTPGGKLGCPAGYRENLDNRVGLLPCVIDTTPVVGTPRQPTSTPAACGGSNLSWSFNGNVCSGAVGGAPSGGTASATSSNGNTGSAQFKCQNGTWYGPLSGTCVPPVSCPATQVTWAGTDGTCGGTLAKTLAGQSAWASGVRMIINNKPGQTPDGSNGYAAVCQSNGQWRATSQKCSVLPSGCAPKRVYWNARLDPWDTSKCYGDTRSAGHGQVVKVTDLNPSADTNAPDNASNWSCQDGSWAPISGTCAEFNEIPLPPTTPTVPVYLAETGKICKRTDVWSSGCLEWQVVPSGHLCGYASLSSSSNGYVNASQLLPGNDGLCMKAAKESPGYNACEWMGYPLMTVLPVRWENVNSVSRIYFTFPTPQCG